VSTTVDRLSAAEYLERPDPRRTELIDGVVVVTEPTVLHQRVCKLILQALDGWARDELGRGDVSLPLNVVLDSGNVLAPDVLWFDGELSLAEANAPRAPELAVEVRSPSTWIYDIGRKRQLYEQHGVRELWLADTGSRTMLVFRRSPGSASFDLDLELNADQDLTSPMLEGFKARVGDLIPQVAAQ
jgi:Uma2 family endonuclease